MPTWGTASLLEIIFTLASAFGAAFALMNLHNRIGDIQWLKRHRYNGARLLRAKAFRREEVFSLAKLALCVLIGLLAMATPQPREEVRAASIIIESMLLALVLLVILSCVFRHRERNDLINVIEAEEGIRVGDTSEPKC